MRHFILCTLFLFLCFSTAWSQEILPTPQDTVPKVEEATSNQLIRKKERTSKLGKMFNKLVYKNNKKLVANAPVIKNNQNLELGQGKVIRNIRIVTLDPFGYSDSDSLKAPDTKLEDIGNRFHLKTKQFTIRNYLLFKEGQRFDSLKVKESERLIRTQRFVRRVSIYPIPLATSKDTIDVLIRELDSWSIYPTGSMSTSKARIKFVDRNFGGFGHDVTLQFSTNYVEKTQGYYLNYRVNNIQNTFVRANLLYDLDLSGNYIKSLTFDRPFYSPYAKWAGGLSVYQQFYKQYLPDSLDKFELQRFKNNTLDTWFGYSIPLFKSYVNKPVITNLRMAMRYTRQDYLESPQIEFDPYQYYRDSNTYLGAISLSSINYVQDRYIFNYDIIEDVQVGKIFAITGGFKNQYNKKRAYLGLKFAMGGYTKYGYFGTNTEWGSYFYKGHAEQAALKFEGTYFTKLFILGKWRFRHFFLPQLVVGFNRFDYFGDELKLYNVVEGLASNTVSGSKRLSFGYQWQSYAPFEWKGFRINPFINIEGAFLGTTKDRFLDPKLYSRFSIGFVANNDYLVFSSIAISFVYFPTMPDTGKSVFYANSRQYNVDLPNFNYSRPQTISYY
ncbi:MAG: hypothetical protein LBI72_03450 [Flavobacteriaceae bacterium]|jgi:hypothetical protein|nr:hypothetical protein [Flavobacteriaceae bacterium]